MERRKFIIGAGALASGSAAAVGTGAFSTASTDRDANIEVVDDSDALLALESGQESDIVQKVPMSGDGSRDGPYYLQIDFDVAGGGDGVNPDSSYQLGVAPPTGSYIYDDNMPWVIAEDEYEDEHAFRVTNQDTEAKDITIGFEPNADTHGTHTFGLVAIHNDDVVNYNPDDDGAFTAGENNSVSHTAENVAPGDTVYIVFSLQTGTYMQDVDMGGDITITAD